MFLVPSPAEKLILAVKAPATQFALEGALSPNPDRSTLNPVSQLPPTVTPIAETVFAAGEVI